MCWRGRTKSFVRLGAGSSKNAVWRIHEKQILISCALLFALCVAAEAQQAKKIARIGYLSYFAGPPPVLVTFKRRLGELGWVEGKQIKFEYRYAGGDPDKLSEFAT